MSVLLRRCQMEGCGHVEVEYDDDDTEVVQARVLIHVATRHPREFTEATGRHPEAALAGYRRFLADRTGVPS
jgi:hypothetical protein